MSKRRLIALSLTIIFIFTTLSTAQTQLKKRRLARSETKKVEVYFDGGYYSPDLSPADDALNNGLDYLRYRLEGLNDTMSFYLMDPGIISGANESFGGSKSMGGGINYNLDQNWGIGLKINFSSHSANSLMNYDIDSIEIFLNVLDTLILADENNVITNNSRYDVAPVILNGYFRWQPLASALQNLSFIASAGAGVYTTTIEVHNRWERSYHYYWPYIVPFENFYDYKERYVAKPLGAFFSGGISYKGSSAISASIGFEYHLVPEVELKAGDWAQKDLVYYPPYMPEYQEYLESFFDYNPEKLSLSGYRINASLQISF
jgi:hypothetical protein